MPKPLFSFAFAQYKNGKNRNSWNRVQTSLSIEMNNFHWCVSVEPCHLSNPFLVKLQNFFIINVAQPKVNFSVVFFYFYAHSVQLLVYLLLCTNEAQKNVLPHSIALSPLEPQNKGASFFIVIVFPNRLDILLEEIQVRTHREFCGSFEVLIVVPKLLNSGDIGYRVQAVLEPVLAFDKTLVPELEGPCKWQGLLLFFHNIQSIIYGVKCTYNQQSVLMHNQPLKPRQPFLDKFQGKKNAVGKEGLLHLLEQQQQSNQRRHQVTSHRNPKQLHPIVPRQQIKQTPLMTEPRSEKNLGSRKVKNQQKKSKHSQLYGQVLQNRYQREDPLNQFKSQQFVQRVKLPAINKSSSLSNAGRKQHTDIVNAQITGTTGISGSKRVKYQQKKLQNHESVVLNSINKKMQLDSYALRHLEFLDKFEKQLLHNQIVNKRTARSQMHRKQ